MPGVGHHETRDEKSQRGHGPMVVVLEKVPLAVEARFLN